MILHFVDLIPQDDWYLPPPNSLTFPRIANVPNASDIWKKVASSVPAMEQILDQSVLKFESSPALPRSLPHLISSFGRMNAKVKAWNDDLVKTTLNTQIFIPKDYHPPVYTSPSSSPSSSLTDDQIVSSYDSDSKVCISLSLPHPPLSSPSLSSSGHKKYLTDLSSSYDELIESFAPVTPSPPSLPPSCPLIILPTAQNKFFSSQDQHHLHLLSRHELSEKFLHPLLGST
jgi:hypothetical protein